MKKSDLDMLDVCSIYDLPDDTTIEEFDRNSWKSVWSQAVEIWFEDSGAWYDYIMNGFKGWASRTDFEIYCDIRFTHIDGQDKTWDDLSDERDELGKYS